MEILELLEKPVWQMKGSEFIELLNSCQQQNHETAVVVDTTKKEYAYGIPGIAQIFHCSLSTANRIKKSGKIDGAIKQIGRKIVIDKDLALQLADFTLNPNMRRTRRAKN